MSTSVRKWKTGKGEPRRAYVVRWYDAEGKYHSAQFKREREARAHRDRVRGELVEGTHVPDSKSATFRLASALWLDRKLANGVAQSTRRVYGVFPRLHLNPLTISQDEPNSWKGEFGDFKLSRLTSPTCDAVWLRLRKTKSAYVARRSFKAFKSILREARRRGLMKHNPAEPVTMDDIDRGKPPLEIGIDIPDKDDVRAILDAVSPDRPTKSRWITLFYRWRWYIFILTDVATGMRSEELRALLWRNIHLDTGRIRVLHGIEPDRTLGAPKTDAGYRDLLIPPDVVEALRRWKEICQPESPEALVFPTSSGGTLDHTSFLENVWHPVLTRLGMVKEDGSPKYVFHGLRHFYASLMIQAGVQPKRLQKLMGHKRFQTTMDTYGHLFPESETEVKMIHGAVTSLLNGEDDKDGRIDDMAEKVGGNSSVFEATL